MWHGDWSWGAWLVMSFTMVAFWGLVIWAVVSFVRGSNGAAESRPSDPERILAERFAAGEIDEEEYRRRLHTLRATPTPRSRSVTSRR